MKKKNIMGFYLYMQLQELYILKKLNVFVEVLYFFVKMMIWFSEDIE